MIMMDSVGNVRLLYTELLRFTTAGSVDDGKSTLIGRLLYDSKAIFEDQLEAIELSSKRKGEEHINLAYLTDGLKAEREQGITIDVAYRYFATPKRKFIITDTPGHIQYTRNMVTGASTANLAIILVDARNGIAEQTLRHSYIASLLNIPHIVICINKMDLVGYSEAVYSRIKSDYQTIAARLDINNVQFIPISALHGDNVVNRSANMPWYNDQPLLEYLENVEIRHDHNLTDTRLPVQYVIRPYSHAFHDYRGYAGQVVSGSMEPGDTVMVLPSRLTSTIRSIELNGTSYSKTYPMQSVTITLSDDIDISRGNMLVKPGNEPRVEQDIRLMVCWFNPRPMQLNSKYVLRHTTNEVRCQVKDIDYRMNINTLERETGNNQLNMNDIAQVSLRLSKPIFYDPFRKNRYTGSVILVDETTNETVGAGMII